MLMIRAQERMKGKGRNVARAGVWCLFVALGAVCGLCCGRALAAPSMPVVDTGQDVCSDTSGIIPCPAAGLPFSGQDAQYSGNEPAYRDNHDGTVTDLVTGLMWSAGVDETKVSPEEAEEVAERMRLGGHADWRVPNIKELYSLIDFRGDTGSPERMGPSGYPVNAVPYINTDYFGFRFGNVTAGERYIDAQWLSSTTYVGTTMDGMRTLFGVNFADGRIKGYGYQKTTGGPVIKKFYARYVRGPRYGTNVLHDNGDGTVTDLATGLMWMRDDSGSAMSWEQALEYAGKMNFAGYVDWRLPDAKELQTIVDYTRSPGTSGSAAIDPVFRVTGIVNEAGQPDYPCFWTSTTHMERSRPDRAVYIAFGRALGRMRGHIMDVHGAGAQRSDPKSGRPGLGGGPQGDAVRIRNYVRLVRGGARSTVQQSPHTVGYPRKIRVLRNSSSPSRKFVLQTVPGGGGRPGAPRPEMMPPGSGGATGGRHIFMQRHDRNGDGRVSRAEFPGPDDHFRLFDRNSDGYIDENEAPSGPPPGPGRGID